MALRGQWSARFEPISRSELRETPRKVAFVGTMVGRVLGHAMRRRSHVAATLRSAPNRPQTGHKPVAAPFADGKTGGMNDPNNPTMLYHGTALDHLPSILKNGLVPPSLQEKPVVLRGAVSISSPDAIYLSRFSDGEGEKPVDESARVKVNRQNLSARSRAEAVYWRLRAQSHMGRGICIIEIPLARLEPSLLAPTEEFLLQYLLQIENSPLVKEPFDKLLKFERMGLGGVVDIRAQGARVYLKVAAILGEYPHLWDECLYSALGEVAHLGTIAPNCFSGVREFPACGR